MNGSEVIELIKKIGVEKDVYIPCDDGESQFYIAHSVKANKIDIINLEDNQDVIIIDFE